MTITTDAPVTLDPDAEKLVGLKAGEDGCTIIVAAGATVRVLNDGSVYVFREREPLDDDEPDTKPSALERVLSRDGINITQHEIWTDDEGRYAVSMASSLKLWAGARADFGRLQTGGILGHGRIWDVTP